MPAKAALWLRRLLGAGLLLAVWQLASLHFSPLVVPPISSVRERLLSRSVEDIGMPFIHVLQSVPPVCWVVLALVWFGFNGRPCVFIVAAATIPTVVINLCHGVRSVDRDLLEMARLYRFSRWKTLRHITLPSIRPYFRSALEIVIGGGWKLAVMGEVLTTSSGIGGAITTARLNIEPDAIIAWSILLVLGCFATQKLLRILFCRKETRPC